MLPAEHLDALELVEDRCRFLLRLADEYGWDVPDVIIRNQMRMLREAIEKWETEQEQLLLLKKAKKLGVVPYDMMPEEFTIGDAELTRLREILEEVLT